MKHDVPTSRRRRKTAVITVITTSHPRLGSEALLIRENVCCLFTRENWLERCISLPLCGPQTGCCLWCVLTRIQGELYSLLVWFRSLAAAIHGEHELGPYGVYNSYIGMTKTLLELVDATVAARLHQITFLFGCRGGGNCTLICLLLLIRQDKIRFVLSLPASTSFSSLILNYF